MSIVCEECGFIWARSGNYRGFQSLGPARSLSQTDGTILRRLQGDVPKAMIVTSQVMWCDVGYRYTSIAECPLVNRAHSQYIKVNPGTRVKNEYDRLLARSVVAPRVKRVISRKNRSRENDTDHRSIDNRPQMNRVNEAQQSLHVPRSAGHCMIASARGPVCGMCRSGCVVYFGVVCAVISRR
jgi:hypothetical protein